MPVQVRATSAAHADLIQAHDWYEHQSPGLGKEFVRSVDAAFAFIGRNPELLAPVYRNLRRVFTKRFPYAVYYHCPDTETAKVIAVLHSGMDRTRLKQRIG